MMTKHSRLYSLLLMVLMAIGATAQEVNKLYLGNITCMKDKTAELIFYLDNTNTNITALQADITLPQRMKLETPSFTDIKESRLSNHRFSVYELSNQDYVRKYRVVLASPTNAPILANKGKLFSVKLTIPSDAPQEEGQSCPIVLEKVILSDNAAQNVMTAYEGSSVTIAASPDFTVSNVRLTAVGNNTGASTLSPGDNFTLKWQVNNIGSATSEAGWSEKIFLVSTNTGERCYVGTSRHTEERLAAGASLQLTSQQFTVPRIPGLNGSFKVQVELVPSSQSGEHAEFQNNNTAESSSSYTLNRRLYLTLKSATDIEEPGGGRHVSYEALLERSGSRTAAQTFNVTLTPADSRLALKSPSVTIAEKASSATLGFVVTDDNVLNGADVEFLLNVAAANDYAAVSAAGRLTDDEHPDLAVSLSKTQIDEGDELTLTVTASHQPAADLTVQLSNDAPTRFKMPNAVTIAAGTTTATATVKAYDDDVVADAAGVRFTAAAAGYNTGHADALLSDNDMPQISLKLSSSTVTEGAGANAVLCTLTRDKTNAPLSIEVNTSNEDLILSSYSRFTMAKGQRQFQFYLHALDNTEIDGEREVSIRTVAYIPACSCQTTGTVGGTAETTLTVVDNDGPMLQLTTATPNILEGSEGNVFTVSCNTNLTSALTVNLSTRGDHPDIQFPPTVTIPAGQRSTTFTASIPQNDQTGDSRTITLVARAEGYSQASCWVMATDQTLPDATVEMSMQPGKVYATLPVVFNLTVHNYGYAPLPAKTPVSIVADNHVVETVYTKSTLGHGEESIMPISMTAILSSKPATIPVFAVVNNNGGKAEINYDNNTSTPITVNVLPLLQATAVTTDKAEYKSEETVHISGQTEGKAIHGVDLEVYIIQGGSRFTIPTTTDDEGRFAVEWTPSLGMAGEFGVGACMPGEQLTTAMTSFDLYGMRRATGTFLASEMRVDESRSGYIEIVNPGTKTLTSLTAEVSGLPDNVELTLDQITALDPGETKPLAYHLTGKAPSPSFKEWQTASLRITSQEGAVMTQTVNFVIYPNVPQLKSTVSSINTTMTIGTQRTYEFTIYNEGKLETGEISVDVSGGSDAGGNTWLTTATPRRMTSLAPGESAAVVLQMRPTADMEPNSVALGNVFISAANGGSLTVALRAECVSESTGTLVVDVWDEFTANTTEAPHVSGATVAVLHPVTQQLLREAVTDGSGTVTFENLAEGKYLLKVTHPKHESYLETVIVSPARTITQRAFISYSAITVEMVYEPTEVEDVYDIVTTVNYETQVPRPVLTMDMPEKLLVKELQTPYIYYVTLTNVGLIAARDVEFTTETEWGEYRFTPLIEGPWEILPQQSVTIPVEITKVSDGSAQARGAWGQRRSGTDDAGIQCALGAMSKYKGSCAGLANSDDSQEYMARKLMEVNDGCSYISDLMNVLNSVLRSFGFSPSGAWYADAPTLSGNNPTGVQKPTGVARVSCDPCLYDNAPEDIKTLGEMKGGSKTDIAKAGAKLITPCTPGGSEPPPGWPARGSLSRQTRKEEAAALVVYSTTPYEGMSNATLMDCYREIVKVITPVEDAVVEIPELVNVTNAKVELPSWQPSYMKAWLVNTGIAHDLNYHDLGYIYHVTGNTEWPLIETSEARALVAAFQSGETPGDEQLAALHPAALDDEQFAAVVSRLRGFTDSDFALLGQLADRVQSDLMEINRQGYYDAKELCVAEADKTLEALKTKQTSACASVKLQMSQQLTMTRQAVRGTLTMVNAAQDAPIRDVKLNLVVTDPEGNVATAHIMEIHTESISGFTGELDFGSGWELGAGQTGEAKIIFIPTKYAAPTEPLQYTFAGSISFVDPFTGQEMTRELETERLTVTPSPVLDLTYFMQRDIMGDDPLTEGVEPTVPAQFALLISNKGYGDATKVKMVTNQPEVIENEKGLPNNYEIVSSQLNGGEKTLALGSSVATDFGNIPAHSQAYAQWWLTSGLTGHFTDYNVEATHVTSYDNPDLSLLDSVTIHELIHQIVVPQADPSAAASQQPSPAQSLVGFMANDEEDVDDTADRLYLSDGTRKTIHSVHGAEVEKENDNQYRMTVNTYAAGWNYGHITDPTGGARKLLKVIRLRDNLLLPAENFWQTDRTLRDGLQPLYENLLHFCDEMTAEGEQYDVYFENKPAVALAVQSVSGIPGNNSFTRDPVNEVVVTFNKAINAATFTTGDLAMTCEGEAVSLSGVTVEPIDVGNETTFRIDLSSVTTLNGYYSLDIQTAEVDDKEGFHGESGRKCSWIQLADGKVNLTMKVSPEGAGTVTPGTSTQDFDGQVTLTATPAEGYTFGRWVKDEAILSQESSFSYQMAGKATITAVFNPEQYKLTVNYDEERGTVEGGPGLYDYGQQVTLKAVPKTGYYFDGWKHNDEIVSTDNTLQFTIHEADTYEAVFGQFNVVQADLHERATKEENLQFFRNPKGEYYKVTLDRKLTQNQWNTFCVPFDISEQQINKTWGYSTMVVQLKSVEDDELKFEYTWNIKAGVPYLIKPERTVETPSLEYKGNLKLADEPKPVACGDYQYVGIYSPRTWNDYGEWYYGVSSGNIVKAKSTTPALNGFRAYFVIPEGANARISIMGIETVGMDYADYELQQSATTRIYNLQGLYVGDDASRLSPGLYIINGKKQVIR